jgi:hypothetical protein
MNTDFRAEGLEQLDSKNWIYKYLKYTDQMESPSSFHIWSALAALSCTLQRKVWINRGFYTLYPNQYIILVAESAFWSRADLQAVLYSLLQKNLDSQILGQNLALRKSPLEPSWWEI